MSIRACRKGAASACALDGGRATEDRHERYQLARRIVPGFTDNYCSNEVIVGWLATEDKWPFLNIPSRCPGYYKNCADIRFHDGKGPKLETGVRFFFSTFGFPVDAQVVEHLAPVEGQPARVAWHGWAVPLGSSKTHGTSCSVGTGRDGQPRRPLRTAAVRWRPKRDRQKIAHRFDLLQTVT